MATLGEAVVLIGDLPEFPMLAPAWQLACEAVRRAAKTEAGVDIEVATCEFELALACEGLLGDGIGEALAPHLPTLPDKAGRRSREPRRSRGRQSRRTGAESYHPVACEKCRDAMTPARKMPRFGVLPELWTFKCSRCGRAKVLEARRTGAYVMFRSLQLDSAGRSSAGSSLRSLTIKQHSLSCSGHGGQS